ncbi:MAG: EamA family transporter [Holophaga sp.]|jgi:drug/metabolite transporter (DMT)-like permease
MKAWVAYAIVAIVWGSTYFAIALGIGSFTPWGMVSCRYLTGGLAALAVSRVSGEPLPGRRDVAHLMLQGVLMLTLSNALVTWAEESVSSGATAVLCSTTPLFYAVMGREDLGLRGWGGLLLGLGGVGVLVLVRSSVQAVGLVGAGALLLATFLWAWGTLHGRRHVKGRGLFGQVGVQMVTGGALALLLSPLNGGILHAPLTLKAALAVGYLAIFGSLVAFSAFVYISRAWAPSRMSTYVYINPVVAVLLGCLVLGEPFNGSMVLGMAAILVGVGLLQTQRVARTAAVASE